MGFTNNLGILYKNMGLYEKSLESYELCLSLADSIDFDRGKLAAYTNLGILYEKMGQYENAGSHAKLGLQYAIAINQNESLADNLNSIARVQLGLGDQCTSQRT